jgi:hypothetical protein
MSPVRDQPGTSESTVEVEALGLSSPKNTDSCAHPSEIQNRYPFFQMACEETTRECE